MRLYTHVPSSGRRASTGSADGQTTWTVGGTETERHHAAGPAPKSATHRHSHATVTLPSGGRQTDRQKQHADRQQRRENTAGRDRERDKSTRTVQKHTGTHLKI